MKIDVMGVQFDNFTMEEALQAATDLLQQGEKAYCVTPNPEIVYEAIHDHDFAKLIQGAKMVLPDGVGILLGGKILGREFKEKVSGVDFADRLCDELVKTNQKLYLLGSKPGVAELAGRNLIESHRGLSIVGTADGYFKEDSAVVQAINDSGANVLFVCLGSPKQEQFMQRNQTLLHPTFQIGLGGSLDAFAGTVKRAPKWMQKCGLEWLYRLIKEPKRLGRMMRLPKFVFAVVGRRIKGE